MMVLAVTKKLDLINSGIKFILIWEVVENQRVPERHLLAFLSLLRIPSSQIAGNHTPILIVRNLLVK